jgi:hypothetical protein
MGLGNLENTNHSDLIINKNFLATLSGNRAFEMNEKFYSLTTIPMILQIISLLALFPLSLGNLSSASPSEIIDQLTGMEFNLESLYTNFICSTGSKVL